MYAVKRQLRIWKHELFLFWDKIPFAGRILLGAVISIGCSIWIGKEFIQPLNKQVVAISKGLAVPDNLDIAKDEEIIMNKDKAKNLQPSIKKAETDLEANKKKLDILSESARVGVINDFQKLFSRCGLRVITETSLEEAYLLEQNPKKTSTSKKKKTTSRKKVEATKTSENPISKLVSSKEYKYTVSGNFRQIQAFLLLAETLKWRFQISEMSIIGSDSGLLTFDFKLAIYYFK